MTSLVRRYLKTAIAFLAIGLLLGGWMMVRRELGSGFVSSYAVSAHTHALFVGFMMFMVMGVALWMFPRPEKNDRRYRPVLAEAAYWFVAAGTLTRVGGELARGASTTQALRWFVVLSGMAQIVGIALFFFTMWSRIRPVGSKQREEAGERF